MSLPDTKAAIARNRRREQRREQICDAAAQLFAQHGYEAVTIEMIAEAMGYIKTGLYRYVASKEGVFALISERFLARQLDYVRSLSSTLPPDERLRRMVAWQLVEAGARPDSQVVMAWGHRRGTSIAHYPGIQAATAAYEQEVRKLIAEGVREGIFHVSYEKVAAMSVLGVLNHLGNWYSPVGPLPPDQITEHIVSFLFKGLGKN